VASEAKLIVDAAHRVLGGETLSSIVDDWNRRGVLTTTGGPWRINALSALLIQPRLAGVETQDAVTGAPVPAVFDRATHERLLALRRARRKGTGHRTNGNGGHQYLLTGFLHCWRCGSRLGGITPGTTTVQPHYRCPSRGAGGCSGVVVHAAHADSAARDIVIARVADPAFIRSVESREVVLAREEQVITSLVADVVTGRHPEVGVTGLWTDSDEIDGRAWGQLKEKLEATVRTEGSELAGRALLARQRRLYDTGDSLQRRWAETDLQGRRAVIGAVVAHFVVQPAPRRRSRFAEERLQPVWRD